ncbi:hypothetical protein [Streptomyces sp. NPDC004296]|uniref:hypothetical protein n=1 Tax=Streptomyces sp. NPDC004296 TaxID=3364697 RepID=UPI0036C88250
MPAATTTERTAKERVRRTRSRTRTRNEIAPIRVSQLAVKEYDLTPACVSLVCPSCHTWVPINRPNGRPGRTRLVPHHKKRAGTANPVVCTDGSNRRVILDVEVERWQRRLEQGVSETEGRRSNRVTRKPRTAPAPAVSQIAAQQRPAADDEGDGRTLWLVREMGWASTQRAVRDTDARRAQRPAGDVPLGSPPVPLDTLHPKR